MILIDDILISDEVLNKQFVCDLSACKGACCVEGDGGAPVEPEEIAEMEAALPHAMQYMTPEGIEVIKKVGVAIEEEDEFTSIVTPLIDGKACAFVHYREDGTVTCAFEIAYNEGKTQFKKPISCHLYPIRVKEYNTVTAVNFDEWDICQAACTLGEKLQVPTYVFVKDALIRKFGEEFYEVLTQAAKDQLENKEE